MYKNSNIKKNKSQVNNNTSKIIIQGEKTRKILDNEIVKATIQGDKYIDIMAKKREYGKTIMRIDKDEYYVPRTGEFKLFNHSQENKKKKKNIKETFTRLRQLIRTNFTEESDNQLFITLTYKENMTDEKRLYNDFEKFYKRLQYRLKKHKLDYIVVMEPQGRGAWHAHLMLKSNQSVLYIDNKELTRIWGWGSTKTERLRSDDVGSYYVAYFTDLIKGGEKEEMKPASERKIKRLKKGSRLELYPKNFKFYRTSRGIKKPERKEIKYKNLEEMGYKKVYESSFSVTKIEKEEEEKRKMMKSINVIQKETWKKQK